MIRSIIEVYGLGAIPIQQLMGIPKGQEREIIDVDYENLSDQIEDSPRLSSYPSAETIHVMQSEMGIRIQKPDGILKLKL